MAISIPDAQLDAMLGILTNCTAISVCSTQPTTRTEAITTYMLATKTITSGNFTVADDSTVGRKATTDVHSAITITNSGTATHVAGTDGTNLLWVTTCTSQALTAAGTVTIPAFALKLADAA